MDIRKQNYNPVYVGTILDMNELVEIMLRNNEVGVSGECSNKSKYFA